MTLTPRLVEAGNSGRGCLQTRRCSSEKTTLIFFYFFIRCRSAEKGMKMTTRNLLVTSQLDHAVHEYDVTTGAFVRVAATGIGDPLGVVIGADGNLLVSDGQANQVKRFDITTGAFIDAFVSTNLSGPTGMTIHQGALYVTNSNLSQGVQRFDATTGVNTGSFVPSLQNPSPRDVKVNPANNRLYVLYYNAATVETFDLTTMASFGLLMPAGNPLGSGGLFTPSAMAFGPDGNLYISGGTFGGNLGVRRYNATTGEFIDFFANTGSDLFSPFGITFGPDNNLYVSTQNAANVMRFNYPTGAFMDFFVPNGGGGLTAPFHLTFGAGPSILTYTLQQDCLHNANDAGMLWQIEGGKLLENGKQVGNYSSVKRVSCGTTPQNTAQLWLTLFFLKGNPPENITLHGAHDFKSGGQIGSVSAASSAFASQIGKQFKCFANTLSIG
jgi:streptogramin lyase